MNNDAYEEPWVAHSRFIPKNKYGDPLPMSERWGNIMYEKNIENKKAEMNKIRANLERNYMATLGEPKNIQNPVEGNIKKASNGTIYKWTTRAARNERGYPMGPRWQKVSKEFGFQPNVRNALQLEKKHGFEYTRLLKNIKRNKGLQGGKTRRNRKSRRATLRRRR